MSITLHDLVAAIAGLQIVGTASGDEVIAGVALDSRRVEPGFLFAALPGHRTHGSAFAPDAVLAAALLTDPSGERPCVASAGGRPVLVHPDPRSILGPLSALVYGEPARKLRIAGITGTNGKTTVTYLVEAGLRACGVRTGLIGTTGAMIAGSVIGLERTTPEAPDLQALLARMVDEGVQAAAMEVSSIAVAEHRVDGIEFDAAAFTNLSQDHLDYHGDMETYFRAKAELFEPGRCRSAVVCIDDAWGRRLAAAASVPTASVSLDDPGADWFAHCEPSGVMQVRGPGVHMAMQLQLPGRFNAANALCALAVLSCLGVDAAQAASALAEVAVPGRMERVHVAGAPDGIVDYAHSPDAIARVLRAVRPPDGRVIVVIGAGGDRDRSKRPDMGRAAAELADAVIVTDDNPRSEDPASIRAEVASGAVGAVVIADRAEAIRHAVGEAAQGDVVVVLGKGHEQGQERMGEVSPFDDRVELRAALADWGPRP